MKNFLLYAGCARAGSTWLYGALNGRGDCDFSHIKEHFLFQDFTLNPEFDKSTFFDHYESLSKNDNIKLLGEMSPSNGYATRLQLRQFRDDAKKRNFNVLPVMTLRDPIYQHVSAIKLKKLMESRASVKNSKMLFDEQNLSKIDLTLEQILESDIAFADKQISWEETFNNFKTIFGDIHVNFYETMFAEAPMTSLCDYLQIPYDEMDFERVVNKLGESSELTDEDKHAIFYCVPMIRDNYNFAVNKFGKDFIESIWWSPHK